MRAWRTTSFTGSVGGPFFLGSFSSTCSGTVVFGPTSFNFLFGLRSRSMSSAMSSIALRMRSASTSARVSASDAF